MAVNSLGFLFASHIPDWVLKKLATQKQQMDKRKNKMPTKKNQTKKHAQKKNPTNQTKQISLAKGPRKGQPGKKRILL